MFKKYQKLWMALGILIVLSPLGLIASGPAFGEWGTDELKNEAGFIPVGLARMTELWKHAPLPDYGITGFNANFTHSALGYILSALIGVALTAGIMALFSKMVKE